MAAGEGAMPFSLESVVKDVLQQHGNGSGSGSRSRAIDLDSRRAEEAAMRRYEATDWLKKMVGVVGSKDLPTEPSEEEFRLGLRSGIILCNALNKFHHGAVQKVVENPCDSVLLPDGAVLSAYQYFENVRNFLVAVAEMGLPTFETSDLEQGGKSLRVVNCVLALKSYNERKPVGGNGASKFGGNVKTAISGKQHARKNSEPFTGSLSRTLSTNEKSMNSTCTEKDFNIMPSSSLSTLVGAVLSDKNPVEIPNLVESVLTKVMMEFEHHMKNTNSRDFDASHGNEPDSKHFEPIVQIEQKNGVVPNKDNDKLQKNKIYGKESESRSLKQQAVIDQQQRDIKVLKQMLSTTKASMQFMRRTFHEEIHNLGLHIYGVAQAASGYHRVLEENRKLYNQVQDLKGSIRVYCRVRPFQPGQHDYLSTVDHIEEEAITINTMAKNTKVRKLSFNFNKVFRPSATQEEVYSDTQPLVRSVLDGYNVCIFAYGQTGSGKTYTMTGPKDLTESSQGVNYRALRDLFVLAEQRKDTFVHDVFVQMIEIYNEQVRDLLATDGLNKRLEIRNSSHTGLTVPDANLVRVSSTSDVIDLMNVGQRNRAVGATALNDRSSRSHCCLTVHVQGRDLTSGNILRGCMHLVDLAGSERIYKSEVTGDRLKEAQHINKSLSALGDVISALAQKNSHVPYRNSKLTQLLQDSLGGQAKTLMFVHISPEPDAIGETISTLKFAERVATVELGSAQVNKDSTDASELKEQIANLKAALARKDEQASIPRTASGSPCGMDLSPCQSISPNDIHRSLSTPNGLRNPMEDVGNIAACSNPESRPTRSNFNLAELLCKSPTFLPVSSPCQKNREDGRDPSSGDWVDKLMVNKQDPVGVEDHLGYLNLDSNKISEALQEILSEKPVGLFPTKTHSAGHPSKTMDGPNAETREAVLSWQFNHSSYGINHKIIKQSKIPEIRTTNAKAGAMLSERAITRDGLSRSSRWSGNPTVEEKHKARIRKQKNHLGMF